MNSNLLTFDYLNNITTWRVELNIILRKLSSLNVNIIILYDTNQSFFIHYIICQYDPRVYHSHKTIRGVNV